MRGRLLGISLYLIAAGILIQALLAGLFLSGTSSAGTAHVIVGTIVPYLAIVPTVASWGRARDGSVPRYVAIGATVLLIGL